MQKNKTLLLALTSLFLINTTSQSWVPTKQDTLLFAAGGLAVATGWCVYKISQLQARDADRKLENDDLDAQVKSNKIAHEKETKKLRESITELQDTRAHKSSLSIYYTQNEATILNNEWITKLAAAEKNITESNAQLIEKCASASKGAHAPASTATAEGNKVKDENQSKALQELQAFNLAFEQYKTTNGLAFQQRDNSLKALNERLIELSSGLKNLNEKEVAALKNELAALKKQLAALEQAKKQELINQGNINKQVTEHTSDISNHKAKFTAAETRANNIESEFKKLITLLRQNLTGLKDGTELSNLQRQLSTINELEKAVAEVSAATPASETAAPPANSNATATAASPATATAKK